MAKKNKKLTINFSESDIQEMLDAVLSGAGKTINIFNWTPKSKDGETFDVSITVGDDEE